MSDNEHRLDKLEALAATILAGLQETRAIANSNVRAIEATTANVAELSRDRARVYRLMEDLIQVEAEGKRQMYELLGNLSQAQAETKREMYQLLGNLSQAEAETKREVYRLMAESDARQNELSRRQGEIVEILKLLTGKINS